MAFTRWIPALVAFALLATGLVAVARAAEPKTPSATEAALIAGAIDIHVHSYPDDRPRSIDAIDVARLAEKRGMRAIVMKNHYESTAALAEIVHKIVPGVQVFGGVVLNRPQGGINPAAVEHMAQLTGHLGRVVWMPTFDSENGLKFTKESRPAVPVTRDDAVLPEVREVIGLIAKHDLVLATGHIAPAESLLVLAEARRQKVRHMVVTHALFMPVFMTIPQMKQAAALGAYLEFAGGNPGGRGGPERMAQFAEAIRAVGVEHCILSTDLGQPNNPLPPDGMAQLLVALQQQGFSKAELDMMAKENPARLLGLQN